MQPRRLAQPRRTVQLPHNGNAQPHIRRRPVRPRSQPRRDLAQHRPPRPRRKCPPYAMQPRRNAHPSVSGIANYSLRWHALRCPGAISRNAGASTLHRAKACGHRGWK